MPDDTYTPDQTYTLDGTTYFAGSPMPMSVAKEHGLKGVAEDGDGASTDDSAEAPPQQDGTTIPDEIPYRENLIDGGYETLESVNAASTEELDEVDGLGPARIEQIREAIADYMNS